MSIEENKAVARRMIEDVLNANRPDLVGEVFASECRAGSTVIGLDVIARAIEHHHAEYADFRLTIDELVAEGDTVVARGVLRGKHTGEITVGGIKVPPTGKPVECRIFAFWRMIDGKIAEEIAMGDDLGLLKQLGYVAVPATPAAVSS